MPGTSSSSGDAAASAPSESHRCGAAEVELVEEDRNVLRRAPRPLSVTLISTSSPAPRAASVRGRRRACT